MTCALAAQAWPVRPRRRSTHVDPPSLVTVTLRRNGATTLARGPLVEVSLGGASRIVALNGSRVWCARYPGLAGLFRKDRGPSKELGRALCDEVRDRFHCQGFFTTDELPRYGLDRSARRDILAATGAGSADCVVIYAYPELPARAIDLYLHGRLRAMVAA